MAEVYLAQDMLLDREVAVKILRAQFNNDKSLLEQFRREAQSAARLIHPSIVNIFDVCEENSLYFIVMEYVDGRTLKSILEEQGPLKPFWAVLLPVSWLPLCSMPITAILFTATSNRIMSLSIKA